ncbi:L-2-hydroxyglutarate oxidase [Virgibacillus siamensis]|uniref:L-2-hydroxyglutarate oxidase n=1 Tax=Virgibacillus siamensis TaxID=480071 RepID=UPI0009877627|nr:L-2-hydroxyglutarate oxidase [Virgibacillus siamensis]
MTYDYAIIGGGIIGLSVGMELTKKHPDASVIILEKESGISLHQTGRNSGVIHSGIYYKPGSLKAELARQGNKQLVDFCKEYQIPHKISGKVIAAASEAEIPLLEKLYQRGLENQLAVRKISTEELRQAEPHVNGIAAIKVPSTGIVDYKKVAEQFSAIIAENGGEISLDTEVQDISFKQSHVEISTNKGAFESRFLINCAGLFSDRIAQMANIRPDLKIVPFRGEYYELKPEKRHLVKNLVYPVPNPDFPFLGVHFTRMIDGRVLVGPNAVFSFKREGYKKSDFQLKDFVEGLTYPGFLKLASGNLSEGLKEMVRSYSKKAFIKEVQRFVPEIAIDDLIPAQAGVRAQALNREGNLLDDFAIIHDRRALHVCNAPSPAATASIEIGKKVVQMMEQGNS